MEENLFAKNKVNSCIFTFWGGVKVDFTKALAMPITFEKVLDETLNTAQITLTDLRKKDYPAIDVTKAFEQCTEVCIIFADESGNEQKTSIKMLLVNDYCRLQRKDSSPWRSYKHSIQLVEKTKELERLSADTLTFTNPIPRLYDSTATASWTIE